MFFDGSSGAGTVTTSLFSACGSLDTTGFTGTLTGASGLNASGSVTIGAGTTWTVSSLNLTGSGTLTTNGKDTLTLGISGSGTWALGDALTASVAFSVGGSVVFSTANFNITAPLISFASTSNISLGSSTLTVTGSDSGGAVWRFESGVTLSAGTSTIKLTDSTSGTKTFDGAGKTYYNLWLAPGAGTGQFAITGANTFNDIKDDGSVAHTIQFPATLTQTVSSFTVNGGSGQLISLRSSTNGSQFTLSKSSGSVSRSYLDIKDSIATGGATWEAGVGSVNSGNNTGWIFPSFAGPPFNPIRAFAHLIVR